MMKKINDNILLILAFIFLMGAVLMMMSCSATKRVLRDPVKTEKVAVEYIKKNPRKNDTTFIPGSVLVKDTTIYDTIQLSSPVNEKYTERHFTETIIRDTVKIESREFENKLLSEIAQIKKDIEEIKQDRNEWRREAWIHRSIWIAIIIFFAARLFIKVIKPIIKSYIKI